MIQSQSNQALIENTMGRSESPKAVNVYKPTFIINNSFQNDLTQDEAGRITDLNKKYARSSQNKTPQTQNQISGPVGPLMAMQSSSQN